MDYVSVMRQAWEITRRSRVLRTLGRISSAQAIVYSLVILAAILPMTVLPQLTMSISAAGQDAGGGQTPFAEPGTQMMAGMAQELVAFLPAIVGGTLVLFCVWIVLGVFDVAAQAGMIAEADGSLRTQPGTTRSRLREGFGVWWRVVGLSAVAAIPVLLVLLVVGLISMFTVTLPLARGGDPNPAAGLISQVAMAPLQGISSIVTAALGVLVQLAMRSAVLEGRRWRESLRRAFGLVRTNLVHVALTYLLMTVITTVATLAVFLVFGVVTTVLVVLVVGVVVADSTLVPVAVIVSVLAGLALTAAWVFLFAYLIAWVSSVWTILWLRLTQPAEHPVTAPLGSATGVVPS